jgi:eukaryotic-like serine/threonine-protein kinase
MNASQASQYAAFMCYAHLDADVADWLRSQLENYVVPGPLRERIRVAPGGRQVGKVFQDRVDLSADPDLHRKVFEALRNADSLIVLCSPPAAQSRYVDEEIRYFKKQGRQHRIFAAIVRGEPHAAGKPGYAARDECFPPSLIFQVAADGSLSAAPETVEPIAADLREGKDGRENGDLMLGAGLLGVPLDELIQRQHQAERKRRRRAYFIAATMLVLAIVAVIAGAIARREADAARGPSSSRS